MMGLLGNWAQQAVAGMVAEPWPRFDHTSLAVWFDSVADRLPSALQAKTGAGRLPYIDAVLKATDGIPERVFERLCADAGVRWSEVQAIARARFEPPAPVSAERALLALAREYDQIRATQTAGAARTQAMEAVVRRVQPLLAEIPPSVASMWQDDESAGVRLLRVRWLHDRPDATQCPWLVQRVLVEKPFVGYHALLALQQAAHLLPLGDLEALDEAIERLKPIAASLRTDTDRQHAYAEVCRILNARLQGSLLPAIGEAQLLPGFELAWSGDPELAREARGDGRVWCGKARTGAVGTVGDVVNGTDGSLLIAGRERARVVHVTHEDPHQPPEGIRNRVRIHPYPDDPAPAVPEEGWTRVRSALKALAKLGAAPLGRPAALASDDLAALYASLRSLIPASRLWNVYETQDRTHKLELAFSALTRAIEELTPHLDTRRTREVRDIVGRLFTTPADRQLVSLGSLDGSRPQSPSSWPPTLSRDRLARALALRPDDEALWTALQSSPSGAKPAAASLRLWPNGSTLRLRFIGGDRFRHDRVLAVARAWFEHANLKLEVLPNRSRLKADLRVGFDEQAGSWSYVGTDAQALDAHQAKEPTMNLGWVGPGHDEGAARKSILMEFGHALGLIQEHQNPNRSFEWNEDAVVKDLSGPPNSWSRETIKSILMDKYAPFDYRPFDPHSVMLWDIPARWVKTGQAMGGATELSDSDKALIARLYPRTAPGPSAQPPKSPRPRPTPRALSTAKK